MKKPRLLLLVIFAVQILGLPLISKSVTVEDFGGFVFDVGTYFETANSPYLNITLSSTEVVRVLLRSGLGMVAFGIESNCSATSTILTFDGFEANKTYCRLQDSYPVENLTTDPGGKYTYTQDISEFHHIIIQEEPSTIYIRPDGTVTPATAPISVVGNVYTFTDNIFQSIFVQKDDIVIDGDGFTLQGSGGDGVYLSRRSNVTVRNVVATGWDMFISAWDSCGLQIRGNVVSESWMVGILLVKSDSNIIAENVVRRNSVGIGLYVESNSNTVMCNDVSDQWAIGVLLLYFSIDNQFYHNNIVNNPSPQVLMFDVNPRANVFDDGYPSGGNYWSDYTGVDNRCGPNQDQPGKDDIGDTPYIIDPIRGGKDPYPLKSPWTPNSSKEGAVATRAGQSYPILLVSNSTISDIKVTPSKLDFTVAGEEGTSGYVKAMIPVGLNTTEIKVFVNHTKLEPPPYPIIVTNNTHYFIYFALDFTSAYEVAIFFAPITATVDIDPDVLNMRSEGKWITLYLELPEGYDVADVNRITVLLNDTITVDSAWIDEPIESLVGDYDSDDIPDLMVKFDRATVIDFIMANAEFEEQGYHKYADVTLAITGTLCNGIPFEGSDTIRAIICGRGGMAIYGSLT